MGEAGLIGGSLYSPLEAISRGTEGSNPLLDKGLPLRKGCVDIDQPSGRECGPIQQLVFLRLGIAAADDVPSASRTLNEASGAWQHSLPSAMEYTSMSGVLVLVDLDRLHHPHLLMVHNVAVQHEDAGVVEEARANDGAAAFGRPRHDHSIAPRPIGLRLTADLDDLERVGVDVEHMVVVLVGVADRPFLHRAQPHPLVDARGIEDLAVHGEGVFLPVARDIVLRRGGPRTTVRRPVISLSPIVSSGGLGSADGSFIGSGLPPTTTRASGPVGDG